MQLENGLAASEYCSQFVSEADTIPTIPPVPSSENTNTTDSDQAIAKILEEI